MLTHAIRQHKGDLFEWRSGEILAQIDTVRLTSLAATSSGSIDVGPLQMPALHLTIAGNGDIGVAGQAPGIELSIAGSGDVRYAGQVSAVKSSIVGSGSVRRR